MSESEQILEKDRKTNEHCESMSPNESYFRVAKFYEKGPLDSTYGLDLEFSRGQRT